MPSITEFKKTQRAFKASAKAVRPAASSVLPKVGKRRPGRDDVATASDKKSNISIQIVEVNEMSETHNKHQKGKHPHHKQAHKEAGQEEHGETAHAEEHASEEHSSSSAHRVDINFPGSEVLRAKFPKSFEAAENVATDWVNDGKFEELPVKNPLAKAAIQQGLVKAREIEKKVMASPLTEKVAVKAFTYAAKAQGIVNNIRAKVQKKNGN